MFGDLAPGLARLGRIVLCAYFALGFASIQAQEIALQASLGDRLYVLVDEGDHWGLVEAGAETMTFPGREITFDALAALDSGWLLAGHRPQVRGAGHELVLLRGGEGRVESLRVPPAGAGLVLGLRLLVEEERLVGLAWLEGADPGSLGVRAAAWSGAGFSPAEWISEPADGSQLALSGAVLNDGTWLLVWSAFDGTDDEVLYSWRDGKSWSAPARMHADNQVPDITPVVAVTANGAVAAWSRFERGHYRVRLGRFRAGSWRSEERVGGPGSLFPFFVEDGAERAPDLVFPAGVEGGWLLLELGPADEVKSRSRWQGPAGTKPLVRRGAAGRMRLEWPASSDRPGRGEP